MDDQPRNKAKELPPDLIKKLKELYEDHSLLELSQIFGGLHPSTLVAAMDGARVIKRTRRAIKEKLEFLEKEQAKHEGV